MSLLEWFEKGLTPTQYIEGMKVLKSEMSDIYNAFALTSAQLDTLQSSLPISKVIAISEDWCGDAMLNNPILLRIAESKGWDVRFLLRDSNLELMDQYLTNGTSRAIPIYIFLDDEGQELAVWGPRTAEAQQIVEEGRAKLPATEAEDFKDKQVAFYKSLMKTYREDITLWNAVANSIIVRLQSNF